MRGIRVIYSIFGKYIRRGVFHEKVTLMALVHLFLVYEMACVNFELVRANDNGIFRIHFVFAPALNNKAYVSRSREKEIPRNIKKRIFYPRVIELSWRRAIWPYLEGIMNLSEASRVVVDRIYYRHVVLLCKNVWMDVNFT